MSTSDPDFDQRMMRRAIRLAMEGRGDVEPNPMVGCLLVKDGRVIGQGYHARFGGDHAEAAALSACRESPSAATAYVTLEPCRHLNKKTPPCVPRLIDAGIGRVAIGAIDPDPNVRGAGVAMLRAAGITVDGPILPNEANQLLAPFFARVALGRPYVTAKWAQFADGVMTGPMGQRVHITNGASDRAVHELRARCDAIAVGTNTVLGDDPLLTARGVGRQRPLLRVMLSNSLKIPISSQLVATARQWPVVVYSSAISVNAFPDEVRSLRAAGVEVIALPPRGEEARFSFADVLHDLHGRAVTHLLVEPGPTLCRKLLERGQLDRAWVFRSPKTIEADPALDITRAPELTYPATGSADLAGDVLTEYLNPTGQAFFSVQRSADLVRVAGDPFE